MQVTRGTPLQQVGMFQTWHIIRFEDGRNGFIEACYISSRLVDDGVIE